MTALERTLGLESYRDSLALAARFASNHREAFTDSLRFEVEPPAGVALKEWSSAVGALRFAYEVAVREGFEGVQQDITAAVADRFEPLQLESLLELLTPDPAVDLRIAGTRERDAMLPNLVNARFSLDLRATNLESEGELELAPTVTLRLEFDEHVAGQDAIAFQVPLWALDELVSDLQLISSRLKRVDSALASAVVPRWARAATRNQDPS